MSADMKKECETLPGNRIHKSSCPEIEDMKVCQKN